MQTTKQEFRDVSHRPRRKMSKRAERQYRRLLRDAEASLMASAYDRMCRMEGGR